MRHKIIACTLLILNMKIQCLKIPANFKFQAEPNDTSRDGWKRLELVEKPIDRYDVKCEEFPICWKSDRLEIVCGSDMRHYWNPGVLQCFQRCYPELNIKVHNFGVCVIEITSTESADLKKMFEDVADDLQATTQSLQNLFAAAAD